MKFLSFILTVLAIDLTSCSRKIENEFAFKCVQGKIIRWDCEQVVIEIIDSLVLIGDSVWEDHGGSYRNPSRGIYHNVIAALNTCDIAEALSDRPKDVIIYFDIRKVNITQNDCANCDIFYEDKPKSTPVSLVNVSMQPCKVK